MRLLRRIKFILRHRRHAAEVASELEFHLQMLEEEHRAAGLSPEEAHFAARRQLGNTARAGEQAREIWVPRWLENLAQDLRHAVRGFRRSPGFTSAAVLALALGIGANTAIFSLVNAVVLRPLPVREPGQLVQVARITSADRPSGLSYSQFEYFRDNLNSVSGIFALGTARQSIVINGEEELVTADLASGSYFRVLGVDPIAGRLLGPADDALTGAVPAAVISDRFWARRFGRSPTAIGQPIALGERVFTIVGVTPSPFQSAIKGHAPDITLPLVLVMSDEQRGEVSNHWLHVLARRNAGVTVAQTDAEVRLLYASFLQSRADREPESARAEILRQRAAAIPAPGGSNPLVEISHPLFILMGIVGLILALICVNLSALLLARTAARQGEVSIRLAIGATRGRLVRQLLTESVVLASIGGAIGLVIAHWFSTRLVSLFADGRDVVLSVAPDRRVLAFTCAVALLACAVASLAPALRSLRVDANPGLKGIRAGGRRRLEKGIVVAQVAISMVLIVGATLFVGTLVKLYAVDPGFDSEGVLVLNVRSTEPYPEERAFLVQEALLDRLRGLPGVQSGSAVATLPIGGNLWMRNVEVEGQVARSGPSDEVGFNVVAPEYFATIGTPLLTGREFSDRDDRAAPRVAIVNESFARYYFGGGSPLGRSVTSVGVTYEIVGVVGDAKYQDLRDAGLRTMYIPWMQREGEQPSSYQYLARITAGDPLRLSPALQSLVREVDPDLRVQGSTTYAAVIGRSIAAERIMGSLGGLFGLLALVVAGLGIFGVLAFQVARRTNELGLRMALGATRWSITRLVLTEVAGLLLAGMVIGTGAGYLLTRLTRALVFGFTPGAPGVFAISATLLAGAALLAGWLPARRASNVDPLIALRHE